MNRCICANCGRRYDPENDACPSCHEIEISGWETTRRRWRMMILNCPFCGAKSDDDQVIITWLDDTTAAVHCKKCAAYGPYGKDPEEAVEKWNMWYHWWLLCEAEEWTKE